MLHSRLPQNGVNNKIEHRALRCPHGRIGDCCPCRHSFLSAERRDGFRKKRDRCCGNNGRLSGVVWKYSLGTSVHAGERRQPCLLSLPDVQQEYVSRVLERRGAAQLNLERSYGSDVDWQLLSLRGRRSAARTLGSGRGLAAVHLDLDRYG